jgi:arylsulfatase A-like enzyme
MHGPEAQPNIVLVVMDCVRAWDFPSDSEVARDMPFLQSLRDECVVFPRAASVAPWTIPSHATMLTGLYPWQHGTHAKRSLKLNGTVRLPDLLRPLGYRSVCLSSNFLLSPATGLVDGFDEVAWGNAFDLFLRLEYGSAPPNTTANGHKNDGPNGHARGLRSRLLGRLPYDQLNLRAFAERNIFAPTLINRILQKMKFPEYEDNFSVGRWIEPSFDRFVRDTKPGEPFFALLNFCDAHEPYFADWGSLQEIGGWWPYLRLRQDRPAWLARQASNGHRSRWNLKSIHRLYRAAIRRMDRRLQRIVTTLRESGRWDNTMLVITSDHGQAMGENGILYHRFRADDSLIRIPLWVRFPHGRFGGRTALGWASLIDLAPTFLAETASPAAGPARSGIPLAELIDAPRPGPIFAMSDGIIGENWIPAHRKGDFDRIRVAAYEGRTKVILERNPEMVHAFDIESDPRELRDLWSSEPSRWDSLAGSAREVAQKLEGTEGPEITDEIEDRLKSWGYL